LVSLKDPSSLTALLKALQNDDVRLAPGLQTYLIKCGASPRSRKTPFAGARLAGGPAQNLEPDMYNNNQEVLDRMNLNAHQRRRACDGSVGNSSPGEDCSITRPLPNLHQDINQQPLCVTPASHTGKSHQRIVALRSASSLIHFGKGKSGTKVTLK